MSAKGYIWLATYSYGDGTILRACFINLLPVYFNCFNSADLQILFFGNTKRCTDLKLPGTYVDTNNYWIWSIKYSILDTFKYTREYRSTSAARFSLIFTSFDISCKFIEKMINNIGSKNFDTFFLCNFSCFRSNTDIKCKNSCILFLLLGLILS